MVSQVLVLFLVSFGTMMLLVILKSPAPQVSLEVPVVSAMSLVSLVPYVPVVTEVSVVSLVCIVPQVHKVSLVSCISVVAEVPISPRCLQCPLSSLCH